MTLFTFDHSTILHLCDCPILQRYRKSWESFFLTASYLHSRGLPPSPSRRLPPSPAGSEADRDPEAPRPSSCEALPQAPIPILGQYCSSDIESSVDAIRLSLFLRLQASSVGLA
ncbi:hypothetical protein EUGRSUZ_H02026 [Eucalyptus grandis]|uniref:Uncharacterized protein n=2 Tax=Eucalyptus grandis TaxID=71139 RepID=A0ACC3JQ46_EUCGR|nr:hypothetical protein EUGRSUZ_H02026 [Eucalyptus grandis]